MRPSSDLLISRRAALHAAGFVAATLSTSLLKAATGEAPSTGLAATSRSARVVVTGGHPGDPECGCGGTIARFVDRGDGVVMLYLNKGDPAENSVKGPSPVRVIEAQKAGEILKSTPAFVPQVDGHAIVDATHYDQFYNQLEAERPDVVFTHWPLDNHRDHRAMYMLVFDAWLRAKKRFALYYYEVSNGEDTVQFAPTDWVDVTQVEERKRKACFTHASQNPAKFYALQEQVMRMRGIERGCKFAEGFIRQSQSPTFSLPN